MLYSALEHVRMLILSIYVLLARKNAIYKYGHAWGVSERYITFLFLGFRALYLRLKMCYLA